MTQDPPAADPPGLTVIACDESGHEGDRVFGSANPVFTHAGIHLDPEQASEIVGEMRYRLKAQSPEIKAKQLLRSRATLEWLFSDEQSITNNATVWVLDKKFFLTSKMIDLLLEEVAHENGVDLYENYEARQIAYDFHSLAPRSFPSGEWDRLLEMFNSLVRINQRSGQKATVDELFERLEWLRWRCYRQRMEQILDLLLQARSHAESIAQSIPAIDPLFAGIYASTLEWWNRTRLPVRMIHDNQSSLTPERIAEMVDIARNPYPLTRRMKPVDLVAIELHDSKSDPRVQLADVVAGVVRAYSEHMLFPSKFKDAIEPAVQIRSLITYESVTATQQEWRRLTGRKHRLVL